MTYPEAWSSQKHTWLSHPAPGRPAEYAGRPQYVPGPAAPFCSVTSPRPPFPHTSFTWIQPPCRSVFLTLSYIKVTGWRVTAFRIPRACSGPQPRISDLEDLSRSQILPLYAGPWPVLGSSKGLETTDSIEGGGSKRHTERAA